jgi:hypothetical protein
MINYWLLLLSITDSLLISIDDCVVGPYFTISLSSIGERLAAQKERLRKLNAYYYAGFVVN